VSTHGRGAGRSGQNRPACRRLTRTSGRTADTGEPARTSRRITPAPQSEVSPSLRSHLAAFALEGESEIGATGAVLSVAIPFAIFVVLDGARVAGDDGSPHDR
jgi:hypothetical protein